MTDRYRNTERPTCTILADFVCNKSNIFVPLYLVVIVMWPTHDPHVTYTWPTCDHLFIQKEEYSYLKLNQLRVGMRRINVYGVVKFFHPPRQSHGNGERHHGNTAVTCCFAQPRHKFIARLFLGIPPFISHPGSLCLLHYIYCMSLYWMYYMYCIYYILYTT